MSGKKVEVELYTMDPARQEMTPIKGGVAELELGGKYLVHIDGPATEDGRATETLAEALRKKLYDIGVDALVLSAPGFTFRVWKVGDKEVAE